MQKTFHMMEFKMFLQLLSMFYKNELGSLQLLIPGSGEKTRTWHLCYKAIYITLII